MTGQADQRQRELSNASSTAVLRTHTEPTEDMQNERARATFLSDELAEEMNEGQLDSR